MKRAIFLDRDGTLNALVNYADTGEYESPRITEDFILLAGIESALNSLIGHGYSLFLVSNQPSFAKGKTTLANLENIHRALVVRLADWGIQLTEAYYCYHHPRGIVPAYTTVCQCRKPGIQSLLQARDVYNLNLSESWMIGDQDTDVQCGLNAGCNTILLDYKFSANKRDLTPGLRPNKRCSSLEEATIYILRQQND